MIMIGGQDASIGRVHLTSQMMNTRMVFLVYGHGLTFITTIILGWKSGEWRIFLTEQKISPSALSQNNAESRISLTS